MLLFTSCNQSDYITESSSKPIIKFDDATGVFTTKVGREVVISPIYKNVDGATYAWRLDKTGVVISTESVLRYTFESINADDDAGYYITLEVTNGYGTTKEEVLVEVLELVPPTISFALMDNTMEAERGVQYLLTPDVRNSTEAKYKWSLRTPSQSAAVQVGLEASYTFSATVTGDYSLTLETENEDGRCSQTILIKVVDALTLRLTEAPTGGAYDGLTRTVALGRSLTLQPYVWGGKNHKYSWTISGREVANTLRYTYTPASEGSVRLMLTVSDDADAGVAQAVTRNITRVGGAVATLEFEVVCCKAEGSYERKPTASSSAQWSKVYEYTPAPGQFINDRVLGGFSGAESSAASAAEYAERRLKDGTWVSLGSWGGYIVVGFDHSIENSTAGYAGGYNFSISGNQFKKSSEAGIVWVMQDTNGNGLPDDEWYELQGSESETTRDYAVTYYRPTYPGADVRWRDNRGATGSVDYLAALHSQSYYYPSWIAANSYVLYGTLLKSRTHSTSGEQTEWDNEAFDWGYADNFGSDCLSGAAVAEGGPCRCYFKIANAKTRDGKAAELKYIDFVKVQTGVLAKAGVLGEVSTEVVGFTDENMNQGK